MTQSSVVKCTTSAFGSSCAMTSAGASAISFGQLAVGVHVRRGFPSAARNRRAPDASARRADDGGAIARHPPRRTLRSARATRAPSPDRASQRRSAHHAATSSPLERRLEDRRLEASDAAAPQADRERSRAAPLRRAPADRAVRASSIASRTATGSRGHAPSRKQQSERAMDATPNGSASPPISLTSAGTVARRCSSSVCSSWRPTSSAACVRAISARCEPSTEIGSKTSAPALTARSRAVGRDPRRRQSVDRFALDSHR